MKRRIRIAAASLMVAAGLIGAVAAVAAPAPAPPGQAPPTCNGLPATIVGTEVVGLRGRDLRIGTGTGSPARDRLVKRGSFSIPIPSECAVEKSI